VTRWLVITLIAPLASFGERAGNAERSTADRPTRSALIGLAGAALGVWRDDAKGQEALRRSFRIATATVGAGSLVSDFHTFQSLPSAKGKPQTRADALAQRHDLVTSITRREYRADVWFEAAYAAENDARWSLEELAEAFRRPRFTLFLGRKSCPLAAPLAPVIEEAADLQELFRRRRDNSVFLNDNSGLRDWLSWRHKGGPIAAEREEDLGQGNRTPRLHRRQDEPGNRIAWQFSARREFILPQARETPDGGSE
jgi:CRISPR system Cascade subunit CasD